MSESKRLIDELRELDAQFSFPGTCGEAAAELTRLRAENDALRADAERYRYWRDHHGWTGYFDDGASNSEEPTDVDAAIDAARAALKEAK